MSITTDADNDIQRVIIVSIVKREKREGLFKYIDNPANDWGVIENQPASKRVISIDLFNKLQSKIDAYSRARVTLADWNMNDNSYEPVEYAIDTKPMSEAYNGILRRLRS